MKRTPELQRLEEILRVSRIVSGGFMGNDPRVLEEILDADAAEVSRHGYTTEQIASRMLELTKRAQAGLGTPVKLDEKREGFVDENRGQLVCPWPHAGRYLKTVTNLRRTDTGEIIRWSDLAVHMIGAHGFFQGRGSAFRLEPGDLVQILFD